MIISNEIDVGFIQFKLLITSHSNVLEGSEDLFTISFTTNNNTANLKVNLNSGNVNLNMAWDLQN